MQLALYHFKNQLWTTETRSEYPRQSASINATQYPVLNPEIPLPQPWSIFAIATSVFEAVTVYSTETNMSLILYFNV
jgi:hypothetical protein